MSRISALLLLVAVVLGACSGPLASPSAVPTTPVPTAVPTATPTPNPLPPQFEKVWPEITQCFKKLPDIEWDRSFVVDMNAKVNSSNFHFDGKKHKVVITDVTIAGGMTLEKQSIALMKASCYAGTALQAAVLPGTCLKAWTPQVQICMPPELFTAVIDATSTSYMSEEQQKLFFGGKAPVFHLELGSIDSSCETINIFQIWSDRGVIQKADFNPILIQRNCIR